MIGLSLRFNHQDAATKVLEHMGCKPDLIIGNYTDGNLVASLMASKLGITQATIAHALEKTKYEDSDVKWKGLDPKYHFSCQFTADLIAMNATDFVITSTYQEIAGRFISSSHKDISIYPFLYPCVLLNRCDSLILQQE